jgi:hypothetical protein
VEFPTSLVYRCKLPKGLPDQITYLSKNGETMVIENARKSFEGAHKTGWVSGVRDWLLPPRRNPRVEMQQASFLSKAGKIGLLEAQAELMRLELVVGKEKARAMILDFMKRERIPMERGPLD